MFGAYYYSWQSAYAFSPVFGYISLVDPLVYIMEGTRSAVLGPEGYLPFWICMTTLWCFIFAFGYFACKRLKRRLDAV